MIFEYKDCGSTMSGRDSSGAEYKRLSDRRLCLLRRLVLDQHELWIMKRR